MSPDLKAVTTMRVDGFAENPWRYRVTCAACGEEVFAEYPPVRCGQCEGLDLAVEPFGPQEERR